MKSEKIFKDGALYQYITTWTGYHYKDECLTEAIISNADVA